MQLLQICSFQSTNVSFWVCVQLRRPWFFLHADSRRLENRCCAAPEKCRQGWGGGSEEGNGDTLCAVVHCCSSGSPHCTEGLPAGWELMGLALHTLFPRPHRTARFGSVSTQNELSEQIHQPWSRQTFLNPLRVVILSGDPNLSWRPKYGAICEIWGIYNQIFLHLGRS